MKLVAWHRLKSAEIVGMTLIELLLLFVFTFLLVMNLFYKDREIATANDRDRFQIATVAEEITQIATAIQEAGLDTQTTSRDPSNSPTIDNLQESKKILDDLLAALTTSDAARILKSMKMPFNLVAAFYLSMICWQLEVHYKQQPP